MKGSFISATLIGCKASIANGSARPLETVFAQVSPSVGAIKPAATSTDTDLITVDLPEALGVSVAAAIGVAGTVGGATAGGAAAAGAGVAAGAGGLALSPQLVMRVANIPIAPR